MRHRIQRRVGGDQPGCLQAVHLGHADVHQDHVGPLGFRHLHRFNTVGRLTDNLDAFLGPEKGEEPAANERLIIGNHDPDRHRAPLAVALVPVMSAGSGGDSIGV